MSSLDKHLKKGKKKQRMKWAGPLTENERWKQRRLARERKQKMMQEKKNTADNRRNGK